MQKKRLFYLLASLIFSLNCFSQVDVGGTCGIGITNNYLSVDFAPEITYTFISHIKVGGSPFWLYNKELSSSYWTQMYGARVFAEYHFDFNVFVHAEYEYSLLSDSEGYHATLTSLPIGVGGTTRLTERTDVYALVLYDVLYDEALSGRTNPMVRAGVRYHF